MEAASANSMRGPSFSRKMQLVKVRGVIRGKRAPPLPFMLPIIVTQKNVLGLPGEAEVEMRGPP
jgi:hypothetical protein